MDAVGDRDAGRLHSWRPTNRTGGNLFACGSLPKVRGGDAVEGGHQTPPPRRVKHTLLNRLIAFTRAWGVNARHTQRAWFRAAVPQALRLRV